MEFNLGAKYTELDIQVVNEKIDRNHITDIFQLIEDNALQHSRSFLVLLLKTNIHGQYQSVRLGRINSLFYQKREFDNCLYLNTKVYNNCISSKNSSLPMGSLNLIENKSFIDFGILLFYEVYPKMIQFLLSKKMQDLVITDTTFC